MCKYFLLLTIILFSFPSCKDLLKILLILHPKVADLIEVYMFRFIWPYQYLRRIRTKQFVYHFFQLLYLFLTCMYLCLLALDFSAMLCKSRISSKRTLLFSHIIHFLVDHLNKLNQFHYCRDQLSSLNKIWLVHV